jgi:hypothetical protein
MVDRKTIRPVHRLGPEPQDQSWLDSEELTVSLNEEHAVDAPVVLKTGLDGLNPQQHV